MANYNITNIVLPNGDNCNITDDEAAREVHTHSDYMTKVNPTGTGSLSLNRKSGTTVGETSVALGNFTTASGGLGATALGNYTVASGDYSFAQGYASTASGTGAFAIGDSSIASGAGSYAEGGYTKASSVYQHVQGKYNIEDTDGTYAHIVGNGESESARSNIHTLDWDGNACFGGDVIAYSTWVPEDSEGGTSGGDVTPISLSTVEAQSHDAANITTGVLPVAYGGTGLSTTAKGAFFATAAGGAPKFGTLPVAQGGTGATSAANARTKLGLTSGTWTPSVTGFTTTTTAVGHYITNGNYVVISFFIRGTVNGSTSSMYITGIPFSANADINWFAGGGHWQGGQIALGSYKNCRFSGYILAGETGRIYPRVSGTAGTSGSSNITTGYIAATGGDEVYASGTIMYLKA